MKANQLAALVLRLLGIYLLIEFVPVFSLSSTIVPYIMGNGMNISEILVLFGVLLFTLLQISIGILLIVKAAPLGERLTRQITNQENIVAVSFEQVQAIAFAVVGVLIFAGALPQLLNSIWTFLFYMSQSSETTRYPGTQLSEWRTLFIAIGTILKAGLGLWMFFGAHGFSNFWRSMRSFGTPVPPAK